MFFKAHTVASLDTFEVYAAIHAGLLGGQTYSQYLVGRKQQQIAKLRKCLCVGCNNTDSKFQSNFMYAIFD
jgi:hypothetical protein